MADLNATDTFNRYHGPEFTGNLLMLWAAQQNITLRFIQPGKPQQNAYIERYNRTVRYDWPMQHIQRMS